MSQVMIQPKPLREAPASVYCPICTHTVQVQVLVGGKQARVKPGQKCPRCASCIDAGCVLSISQAA
ncbi:MAG: hypothetical protein JJE04_13655 [Acidobacteriia bacterium]|nr:hypothetical protein [Terriglobia bacterium]